MRFVVPTSTSFAPRPLHDVGNPERAADLDELASRHGHLLALREGVEDQQHRGGVVVDHDRRFSAGEPAQPRLDVPVPVPAASGREVELQVARATGHRRHRRDGLLGQRCAPEVGVQHRSGEVEQGDQRWCGNRADAGLDHRFELGAFDPPPCRDRGAGLLEPAAHRLEHEGAAVVANERGHRVAGKKPIHRRKLGR